MADGRDIAVWTKHAEEQWEENKVGHHTEDDYVVRRWALERLAPGSKILDFGCGGGLWFRTWRGFDYSGSDQNENMIKHAKMRYPEDAGRFMVNEWDKLSYEDASFDAVFTSAVLQHNLHPDKEKAVQEIVRVLKPGGLYIATEDTLRPDNYHYSMPWEPQWHEDLDNGYSFTSKGWANFMARFGLKVVEFSPPGEHLFVKE